MEERIVSVRKETSHRHAPTTSKYSTQSFQLRLVVGHDLL